MNSTTDPHGFHDMSQRELIDWFPESGSQPGSPNYEFAKEVLRLKESEAQREASSEQLARFTDAVEEFTTPDPQAPTSSDRLTGTHVAILTVLISVGLGVFGVTGSAAWGFGAALAVFFALLVRPVRAWMARLLSRVVR
jgi:hypothetical protein